MYIHRRGGFFGFPCLDIMLKNKKITFGNTYRLDSALLKIISYIQKCMDLLSIKHKASAFHKLFNSIQTDGRGTLAVQIMMMDG